ncbi:cytochrome c [Bradyrhizobium lablabi]|uniref:c-type cytochrome n=1 Tax=Bradyrhizobium lablabi TaxID=722472 RepID=UPI001BA5F12D|nr:cytochrome c [Bradyrhizobium lablabi]MBR1124869.1 cytochrome c [Bradyrhizobium lablabi]
MPSNRSTLAGIGLAVLLAGSAHAGDSDPQEFSQIERGRYLAVLSDCASCHTVPGSNQPFAGGRAIETPFGNIVAPNITPDLETGIGSWSDEAFDAAVRKGLRRNGSRLYPAMPYTAYTKMSRDDVLAIRAYLNTVTPVRNAVDANTLPFPFNIRASMRVWNALYFNHGDFKPDPAKSAEWNRGAYLVDGPGHCGACHTPKTFLGGDRTDQYLRGSFLQGWSAPDITGDTRVGVGAWSTEDLVAYLKTGHNRVSAATGPMAEVVSLSTEQMTHSDLNAIATYLKSLPGKQDHPQTLPKEEPAMVAGAAIYRDQCSACHGIEGKGIAKLFPSIADSSMVRSDDPTTSIRIVLRGARSVGTQAEPTAPGMPSYRQLDDAQIAAVLTYMRNSWGAAAVPVRPADVARVRSDTALRPD